MTYTEYQRRTASQSEPFDGAVLQSYAAGGHVQPATWIYVERQGRWMAAGDIPALLPLWSARGVAPQYGSAYVQQVDRKGNTVTKWLLGLMIFMAVAVFLILLPIFIRGPHNVSSSSVPATPIVMKSNDGFFAVKIPGNWIMGDDDDPDVPVYYDADASRTISIRKMSASPCSSQQVHTLCAARTSFDFTDKDWVAIGSAVPVTIAGYHGWMQTLHGEYEGNAQVIHLNFISTPKGVYDIAEKRYATDPDGQLVLDNVVKSFHSIEVQPPPTTF